MSDSGDRDRPGPSRRLRRRLLYGGGAVVLIGVAALVLLPERSDPLTAEALESARARWQSGRVTDYDMVVLVGGAQTGRYRISVRDGKLTRFLRDDLEAHPADGTYWTVEGLFLTIDEELQRFGGGSHPGAVLQALFDPKLGYPRRYLRHVPATRESVHLKVERFTVVGADSAARGGDVTSRRPAPFCAGAPSVS